MLKISFTDFWYNFDLNNNIFTNILKGIFENEIEITKPRNADICCVTIYGPNHKRILRKFSEKCILVLGENIRPNTYQVPFSISCDFQSYGVQNIRLPFWYHKIDWYNANLGTIKKQKIEETLINYGSITPEDISSRKDCIAIFNNLEGTRMDLFRRLNSIMKVDAYGKPFKKWFDDGWSYKSKIEKNEGL